MATEQQSSQSFCARPGCGIAKSLHGYSASACANFIAPGSKEAHELRRAHLSVVETPPPFIDTPPYVEFDVDEPTQVDRTLSDAEMFEEWKARALVLGALS
jgi:hypothetical protein